MDDCTNCRYKELCKDGYYAVEPCNCITERHLHPEWIKQGMPYYIYRYQNAYTGKMENDSLSEYDLLHPFEYDSSH